MSADGRRAIGRALAGHAPAAAVWAGAVLYAAVLFLETIRRHETLGGSFDTAHYDQLLWLLSRGAEPFSTIVTRPMLADHFQPAIALLTPLYWLGLGLPGLLAVQAVALALTGPTLFALARAAGATPLLAAMPALAWLACPWVATANLSEFHPTTLSPPVLVLSVYGAVRERYVLLFVTAALALGLREDLAPTYVVLGLLVAYHGNRRVGGLVAAGAALWLVTAYAVLESYGGAYDNYGRRFAGERGDTVGDAARWMVGHPLETLADVVRDSGTGLVLLLASTLCLGLLAPSWMLLAAPTAIHNALSAYSPQQELIYHYHLGTLTALFVAAAIGVARIGSPGRYQRYAIPVLAASAVAVAVLGGAEVHGRQDVFRTDGVALARSVLDEIPPGAPVSATMSLLPHLSHRVEVYSLPEPFSPVDWGSTLSGDQLEGRASGVRFVAYRDGDVLASNGFSRLRNAGTMKPVLRRLGFVEIARAGPLHVLERRGTVR